MNNHLSKDQIAMWIIGRCTLEEERHGRECSVCSAERARFQEPISSFRHAMQDWSHSKPAPYLAETIGSRGTARRTFHGAWPWGTAAAVFAMAAVYHMKYEPRAVPPVPALVEEAVPEQWRNDTALMDAIAGHLSRSIPGPMEPILALIPPTEITSEPGGYDETK